MNSKSPKKLEPIGNFFSQSFASKRPQEIAQIAALRKKWTVIVGQSLAKKTYPTRIQKQCLSVIVESSTWVHHLSMTKSLIVSNIQQHTGLPIETVRFSVGQLPEAKPLFSQSKVSKFAALDPDLASEDKLDQILERVKNLSLRLQEEKKENSTE